MMKVIMVSVLAAFMLLIGGCVTYLDSPEETGEFEILLEVARERYDFHFEPEWLEFFEIERQWGSYFFTISQQTLPAWLSTGLELYWLEARDYIDKDIDIPEWYIAAKGRGLPSLGDEWFIPGFIEDDLSADILSVAYAFVRHLSEIGELNNLVRLYQIWCNDLAGWDAAAAREAERFRAGLWADFTGSEQHIRDVVFVYNFNAIFHNPSGRFPVYIEFHALAEQGWHFFTPSGWTRETVDYYIDVSEEAIQFVENWLGFDYPGTFICIFRAAPHNVVNDTVLQGGGWYLSPRTVVVFSQTGGPPWIFAHEVAHAILDLHPYMERSNFPMSPRWGGGVDHFEEGLCTVIDYLFIAYTENQRFAVEMSQQILMGVGEMTVDPETGRVYPNENMARIKAEYDATGGFEYFEDFKAFVMEFLLTAPTDTDLNRRATLDEIILSVDRSVLWYLDFFDFDDVTEFGERYAVLQSYYTAASFMFYLLEHRGTKEDFFSIYADIYLTEEVYGVDMDGMIEEWLAHLHARFEPWNESQEWQNQFFIRYMEWVIMLEEYLMNYGINES